MKGAAALHEHYDAGKGKRDCGEDGCSN